MTDESDKRRHPRHEIPIEGVLRSGGQEAPCKVRNMSAGGALLEVEIPLRPGHLVTVDLPDIGSHEARVVRILWKFAAVEMESGEKEIEAFIVEWLQNEDGGESESSPG
ncbi:MAG TPA: PilZ domain-containing protein [Alphaproteobacteria bacterium]|nr:PilZ domain-containing protein [Alphaproteobacteria bacterium]